MLLAYQKYATPTGKTGHTYTDYAECEITYISGAGGENDNTYTYDVDLKRIQKDVDGAVTKFVYESAPQLNEVYPFTYVGENQFEFGVNILVEYDGSNNLQATYVNGLDTDENMAKTIGENTYYFLHDGLGSVRNLVDASEVAQNTYDYYAFGSDLGTPTENVTNDYSFTGRRWDSESSLYYYRARMYAPTYGRFTTVDMILQGNLYVYVDNNPITEVDPLGLLTRLRDCKKTGRWRVITEKIIQDYPRNEWEAVFGGGKKANKTKYQCQCRESCRKERLVAKKVKLCELWGRTISALKLEWMPIGRVSRWRNEGSATTPFDTYKDYSIDRAVGVSGAITMAEHGGGSHDPKDIGSKLGEEAIVKEAEAWQYSGTDAQKWQALRDKGIRQYYESCKNRCKTP